MPAFTFTTGDAIALFMGALWTGQIAASWVRSIWRSVTGARDEGEESGRDKAQIGANTKALADLTAEIAEVGGKGTETATGLAYHLKECERSAEATREVIREVGETNRREIKEMREHVDRRFSEMQSQISAVAAGRAGRFREIISPDQG